MDYISCVYFYVVRNASHASLTRMSLGNMVNIRTRSRLLHILLPADKPRFCVIDVVSDHAIDPSPPPPRADLLRGPRLGSRPVQCPLMAPSEEREPTLTPVSVRSGASTLVRPSIAPGKSLVTPGPADVS